MLFFSLVFFVALLIVPFAFRNRFGESSSNTSVYFASTSRTHVDVAPESTAIDGTLFLSRFATSLAAFHSALINSLAYFASTQYVLALPFFLASLFCLYFPF
jgi:hypothetical protein